MNLHTLVARVGELLKKIESELIHHNVRGFTLHPMRGHGRYFDSFNEEHLIKHIQMEVYVSCNQAGVYLLLPNANVSRPTKRWKGE